MYDKDTIVNKAVNEFIGRYDKENKEDMEKSLNSFLFDASLKEFRIHSCKEENMWACCSDELEGAAFFKRIIPSVGGDTFVINDCLNNDSENNTIHALIANGINSNPSLPLGAFIAMDEKMGTE